MLEYKTHYTYEDAYWQVFWDTYAETQLAELREFGRALRTDERGDEIKISSLYDVTYSLFLKSEFGTEERASLLNLLNELSEVIERNKPHERRNPQHWPTDYRHGRKRKARQWKCDESYEYKWGRYESHKISKCWKDQRGKGRNKRYTQYRPVSQ